MLFNWTKSSISMEAVGILEKFPNSIAMHGFKYNWIIGKIDVFHFSNA